MANNATLETRLTQITEAFVKQIAFEVRQAFAAQVTSLVAPQGVLDAPKRRGRPPGSGTKSTRAVSGTRSYPPHCIAEDCSRPHGGPRSGFFCTEHQELPKAEKNRAKAAYRTLKKGA